jgi:hypothetical protein
MACLMHIAGVRRRLITAFPVSAAASSRTLSGMNYDVQCQHNAPYRHLN